MERDWIQFYNELIETLGFDNRPVAVTFTNTQVSIENQRSVQICSAIKLASGGESFVVDPGTSACPGGSWHCGLVDPVKGDAWRILQDFLTSGEKLTCSIVSFQRMLDLTEAPPTGLSDRILFFPMDEAPERPDIVLFLCNPEQACRLMTLDQYWDGVPPRVQVAGSLCGSAIAYPIVTGRTNLTLGDWTARRMQKYPSETVFVTVPYERMENLVKAIPLCSAGTAKIEIPEAMRRLSAQSGQEG